jgi:hypothetical protein
MNRSSRNHHRPTTRWVTAAGHYQHYVEAQTGWGIEKFIRDAQRPRRDKSRPTTTPAAGPLPDDFRDTLFIIRADAHINVPKSGRMASSCAMD